MIRITLDYGAQLEVTAKGHATGAGSPGENLVCCAVSTLLYTCAEAAEELHVRNSSSFSDGFADVKLLPRNGRYEAAYALFTTIATGLCRLAEEYPEYITLRKENDDG